MPINIERTVERAFSRALAQALQAKAEELLKKALREGSPLRRKIDERIERGFERFSTNGIQWEGRGVASGSNRR